MRRITTPCLITLIALLVLARPVRGEEPEPASDGIDPARVAKLLLSDDEEERARGAALLQARMQRGDDARTWLVALARAQAAWANADERLVERWIGDVLRGGPERAERARRLLAAMGRDATRRLLQALADVQALLPQAAGQTREAEDVPSPPPAPYAEPQIDATPPPPAQPPAQRAPIPAVAPPVGRIHAGVIEVPNSEFLAGLAADGSGYGATANDIAALRHERAVLVTGRGGSVFANAAVLPEARVRPVAPGQDFLVPGRELVLVPGEAVRYRSRARRTKGAWAVDVDTLQRGLQVGVRLWPGDDADALVIEARYVTMPDPLPTEQIRPAPDVEPLQLDRPEWEAASLTLSTTLVAARDEVVAFFPGLVPGKVVVVSIHLLPLSK